MNLKLLAAAAAVSVCAFAAPAFANDGYVDASYVNLNGLGSSQSAYTANLAYSANLNPTGWGVQGDVSYLDGDNIPSQYVSGQATVFKRDKTYLYGAYVNYADSFDIDTWEVGALGQAYGDKYTVSGSIGYGQTNTNPNIDHWDVGATGNYYITNNFSIGATASYERLTLAGANEDITVLGAQAEWKPEKLPVSFIASYLNENPDGLGSFGVTSVGVRWNFGGAKTLKDRDQNGVVRAVVQRLLF
jgi:hypothetical protein